MRKIISIVCFVVLSLCVAQATEFRYLVFTNASGTNTALLVTNLTMTVNGSQLDITNADGTMHFALTDLAAMQFSEDGQTLPEGIENVLNADKPMQVFSIGGTFLGTFDNLLQAATQLPQGMYVMVQNGKSQKLTVR